ncbi:hypothetical protein LINPERPRIM_LOCUS2465 [Linum perenne]
MKTMAVVGSMVIAVIFLQVATPFSKTVDVNVLCNKNKFTINEADVATSTRNRLLDRLVANTVSNNQAAKSSRFCTNQKGRGKKGTTIFGLATCTKSTPKQCSTCLSAARGLIKDKCINVIGGQVNLKFNPPCSMRFENTKFC